MNKVIITLCKPDDEAQTYELTYNVLDNAVAAQWFDMVQADEHKDIVYKFNNFPGDNWSDAAALAALEVGVDLVNTHMPDTFKTVPALTSEALAEIESVVLEALKVENIEAFDTLPDIVRDALVDLAEQINRIREHQAGTTYPPRFSYSFIGATYELLDESHFDLFSTQQNFGFLYLNSSVVSNQPAIFDFEPTKIAQEVYLLPGARAYFSDVPAEKVAAIDAAVDAWRTENAQALADLGSPNLAIGYLPLAELVLSEGVTQGDVIAAIGDHRRVLSVTAVNG